jgi:hypothetical protein
MNLDNVVVTKNQKSKKRYMTFTLRLEEDLVKRWRDFRHKNEIDQTETFTKVIEKLLEMDRKELSNE